MYILLFTLLRYNLSLTFYGMRLSLCYCIGTGGRTDGQTARWWDNHVTAKRFRFAKICSTGAALLWKLSQRIAKISVTSPIVINMPTRELLAGDTKYSFV